MTIELLTYPNKYDEQVVAMRVPGSTMNRRLFDATELFMTNNTFVEKQRVKQQAKEFAEAFVAQMNAGRVMMKHSLVKNTATEIECSCGNGDPEKFATITTGSYVHTTDPTRGHGSATLHGVKCLACSTEHKLT